MKSFLVVLGGAAALLWTGCASNPVVLAPVGPNPTRLPGPDDQGQLEVFSAREEQVEGDTSVWYQHADYNVYDSNGRKVRHVGNTVGHYDEAPRRIDLPAGGYLVKAPAKDFLWVEVPVVIEPGRITRVHLDDRWQPPANTPNAQLVTLPASHPVGWRAEVRANS